MGIFKFFAVLVVFGTSVAATNHVRSLIQSLMASYDKVSPPMVEDNAPLNVSHNLQLRRIISLENQVLTLDAYIAIYWQDDRLTWSPDEFGGTYMIRLPSDNLWKPDIMLDNNAEPFSGVHTSDINIVVLDDGNIFYILPVKTKSYCNMDHSKIKRRKHVKCSLKFMSWTHDGLSIDLFNPEDGQIISDFDGTFSKEWKLVDFGVKRNVISYACCPEPYIDLVYEFELEKL